jgi:Protein of unknown function (DUF3619)
MTMTDPRRAHPGADQFGRAVAARLSTATDELPYHVRERLRAARVRALQVRKLVAAAPVVVGRGRSASLALGGDEIGLWGRIGSVLPLLLLAAGLVLIHNVQGDHRASELAEVDQALLTDDLPPAAYADSGFVQFLKSGE